MHRDENGMPFYTVVDLTKVFAVSETCIRALLKSGKLQYIKAPDGRANRIYPNHLKLMLDKYGDPAPMKPCRPQFRSY